jgi:hypothetical protein
MSVLLIVERHTKQQQKQLTEQRHTKQQQQHTEQRHTKQQHTEKDIPNNTENKNDEQHGHHQNMICVNDSV